MILIRSIVEAVAAVDAQESHIRLIRLVVLLVLEVVHRWLALHQAVPLAEGALLHGRRGELGEADPLAGALVEASQSTLRRALRRPSVYLIVWSVLLLLLRALSAKTEGVRRDVVLDGLHGDPSLLYLGQIWRLDLRLIGICMLGVHAKARMQVLRVHVVHVLVGRNGVAEDLQLLVLAWRAQQGCDSFLTLILLDRQRPIDFLEIIILLLFIYKANELHCIVRNYRSSTGRLCELQLSGRGDHRAVRAVLVLLEDRFELVRLSLRFPKLNMGLVLALGWEASGRS